MQELLLELWAITIPNSPLPQSRAECVPSCGSAVAWIFHRQPDWQIRSATIL